MGKIRDEKVGHCNGNPAQVASHALVTPFHSTTIELFLSLLFCSLTFSGSTHVQLKTGLIELHAIHGN